MKIFNIFKKKKVVDDVFDKKDGLLVKFGGFIGNLKLTDEEVFEGNNKTMSFVREFVKETLSESSERSKSRRAIAILWIRLQVGIILMSCIAAPWDMELALFYLGVATSALMFSTTTAIVIFFFGSHGLAKYQDKKSKKD